MIRVAVIGAGHWGRNLIRNFQNIADCTLKTVSDLDESRLRHMTSLYPGVEGVTNADEVMRDKEIDAVVVATPVRHHFPSSD